MRNSVINETSKGRNRGSKWLLLFLVFFFVFAACSAENPGEEVPEENADGFRLYYLNETETKVVSEAYELSGKGLNEQISCVLTALEEVLWTEEEKNLLAEKNPIIGFEVKADGVLSLQFASDYSMVHTTTSVLRRAAIVKTLCQLEGISAVEVYIGAQPLLHSNGKPVGMMKAEDFVDSTGENTEFLLEETLVVYFADMTGQMLVESNLKITYDGTVSTERLVVEQLLKGPLTDDLQAVLPAGTVLNKITVKDGICYVDFNEKFLEKQDGISPEVTVYSVVNSLAELNTIYKVQFLINGEVKKTYQNLDFSTTFERNLDIVEGEQ